MCELYGVVLKLLFILKMHCICSSKNSISIIKITGINRVVWIFRAVDVEKMAVKSYHVIVCVR